MDGWISSGIFAGTKMAMAISFLMVWHLVSGVSGFWKSHLLIGMEYMILFYSGLYQGKLKVFNHLIVVTGCIIFFLGIAGMVPGVMSWLEHLVFPMVMAFSFWAGILIYGACGGVSRLLTKYVPVGVLPSLAKVIGCLEWVSVSARPVIMSVRLLVNVVLGTIVMFFLSSLVTQYGSIVLLMIMMAFFLYEVGVCFFQSFVFTMLLSLYMKEVEW
uniref:ATP synthase subunit a n=1 Tax=Anadara pilula TaxID=935003 RepID=A0A1U9ALR6_9BIVA|nr:ATP synthase F0 subunit 6 [Anadara pilula]